MSEERIVITVREDGSRVVSRNLRSIGNEASRSQRGIISLTGALHGLVGSLALHQLRKWVDMWTAARGKVNIFTQSVQETNYVLDQLVAVAQDARQPLDSTIQSFHQMTLAASALGASQRDILDVTSSVNKVFAIQGTTAMTARGGIIQFGQAMTEGIVRAQEYNSMINAMPLLLVAVAKNIDETGGSVARLRQMMLQGRLTSKLFFDALKKAGPEIEELFKRSGKTLGQGFTILENAIVQYIGKMDQSLGVSRKLFDLMEWGSKHVEALAAAFFLLATPVIIKGITALAGAMRTLTLSMMLNPVTAIASVILAATVGLAAYKDQIIVLQSEQLTLGDYMKSAWEIAGEGATKLSSEIMTKLSPTLDHIKTKFLELGITSDDVFAAARRGANLWIGWFVGLVKTAMYVWGQLSELIKNTFSNLAGNQALNQFYDLMVTKVGGAIDYVTLKIYELEFSWEDLTNKIRETIPKWVGLLSVVPRMALEVWSTLFGVIKFGAGIATELFGKLKVAVQDAFESEGVQRFLTLISDKFTTAIDFLKSKFGELNLTWADVTSALGTALSLWIGWFTSLPKIAIEVWSSFPGALKNLFATAMNGVMPVVAGMVNSVVAGLNKLREFAGFDPLESVSFTAFETNVDETFSNMGERVKNILAASFDDALLTNMGNEVIDGLANGMSKQTKIKDVATDIKDIMADSLSTDYIGEAGDAGSRAFDKMTERARVFGDMRKQSVQEQLKLEKELAELIAQPKGAGEDYAGSKKGKGAKGAKDEFDNPRTLANNLRRLLNTIQPMSGAVLEYARAKKILNAAVKEGMIDEKDLPKYLELTIQHYRDIVNPVGAVARELDRESQMLQLTNGEREIAIRLFAIEEDLRKQGVMDIKAATAGLEEHLRALQRQAELSDALNAIRGNTTGQLEEVTTYQKALGIAYDNGAISLEYYNSQLAQSNIEIATLMNQMGNGDQFTVMTEALGSVLQGYTTLASGVAGILGNTFSAMADGISNSLARAIVMGDNLRESMHQVAGTILVEMISALIKLGIQYVINATLGQAAATAAMAGSIAQAAAVTAAWTPAMTAVSMASFGSNAGPAIAGMAAASVAAKGLMAMPSFDGGGFTGDDPRSGGLDGKGGFLAVMHPKEIVTDLTKGQGKSDNDNRRTREMPAMVFNVYGVQDADSFRRSESQIAARMGQALTRASERNN